MSCLSHVDIGRELGKNIFVYPLCPDNIKGASINLTASNQAWSISTKKTIVKDEFIVIPPNDTALIETEETVHVTKKIAGTYHSKVALVSSGLGHVGTTLDPGWIGPSLIAIHNLSEKEYKLRIGASFVSIMFYYVRTPSKKSTTGNNPGRPGVLNQFEDQDHAWRDVSWRNNPEDLKNKLKESPAYAEVKNACHSWAKYFNTVYAWVCYLILFVFSVYFVIKQHLFGILSEIDAKVLVPVFVSAIFSAVTTVFISQKIKK